MHKGEGRLLALSHAGRQPERSGRPALTASLSVQGKPTLTASLSVQGEPARALFRRYRSYLLPHSGAVSVWMLKSALPVDPASASASKNASLLITMLSQV